jgi:peroxiredoxin
VKTFRYLVALLAVVVACGGAHAKTPTDVVLDDSGQQKRLGDMVSQSQLTAVVFVAPHCPVQQAHEARLRTLVTSYKARGVTIVGVSSEVGADVAQNRALAERLGAPVLTDRDATLADALGAEYSTHTVVFDRAGHILYSGAFDSDRSHLSDDAEPYVKEALDAALEGKAVAKAKTEALGCPLRKR